VPAPVPRPGRVLRPDNTPVAGALVWVEAGSAPTPEIAIRSDGAGRFMIALPAGRFRLAARAPDGAMGSAEHKLGDLPGAELIVVVQPTR
jgi:hypothetical protein